MHIGTDDASPPMNDRERAAVAWNRRVNPNHDGRLLAAAIRSHCALKAGERV
jgi:hypothetical protein